MTDEELVQISIHTPHAGSDRLQKICGMLISDFNPHSPCGERHDTFLPWIYELDISIHTPHAGSDVKRLPIQRLTRRISIHTPHAGSDGKYAQK